MPAEPTYEEQFGPLGRRARRLARVVRSRAKRAVGGERHLLLEIKWRLGDEIMALPVYEALKKREPGIYLTVLCNYPGLLEDNPFVDVVNDLWSEPDEYRLLRDAARDVPRLVHYAARAGLPHPSEWSTTRRPHVQYWNWHVDLLDALPANGPRVVLCTGASWPTKRWPVEKWRDLAHALTALGCDVVQLGHGDASIGVGTGLVGKTSVREAACILRASRLAVVCDSGVMHLARAVGTPTVALFGPTAPGILIHDDPQLHVVTNGRACRACWNTSLEMSREGVCPRDIPDCLDTIDVATVLETARGLLPPV
jgi:ADP-heptose:LPS heptosyltransferase